SWRLSTRPQPLMWGSVAEGPAVGLYKIRQFSLARMRLPHRQDSGGQGVGGAWVLGVEAAQPLQVVSGGESGEGAEVVLESGAVGIPRLLRHLRPGDEVGGIGVECVEHALQTVQTGQRLGRRPHQSLELGDEMTVAQAELLAERLDRALP